MKGVVLAGGRGTHLYPVTKVVNKHLLDIYDQPMIFYPIRTLAQAGVTDVIVVTGDDIPRFRRLLGDGSDLGVRIEYAYQESARGIPDALAKTRGLVGDSKVVVILGDNYFERGIGEFVREFDRQPRGAKVLLKKVSVEQSTRLGVATVDEGAIVSIEEKPPAPTSNLAVTGCYMYQPEVFEMIRSLVPSARGELEITDLNNRFVEAGDMTFNLVDGAWLDAGTPTGKLEASVLAARAAGRYPPEAQLPE